MAHVHGYFGGVAPTERDIMDVDGVDGKPAIIEGLLNSDEKINVKELISVILTALVGRHVPRELPPCLVQHSADEKAQLEADVNKLVHKPCCSADDVKMFFTALYCLVNCCGYDFDDTSPSLLISAANNNNIAIVLSLLLLDHGVRYDHTSQERNETILHIACRLKSELRYVYVLLYPSLLTVPDINGNLPIHIACQNNDIQFLSWLFKSVVCSKELSSTYRCPVLGPTFIEAKIASYITPPLSSVKYSKLSGTTLTGQSVYHIAVLRDYSQLLGLLLDVLGVTQDVFDLDVVITPDYGENKLTPLDVAIAHQETDCVRLLLEFLNKHGLLQDVSHEEKAMKISADIGNVNIVTLLIEYGFSQGLEGAIGKVQDQQLKRLLLYYYTQLTTVQAITEPQSDYKKGLKAGQIRWNGASIEKLEIAWINDCFSAMESVSQAISHTESASQSLYDLSAIQYLASKCLSYFESGKLCTQQLNTNPLIPITVVDITSCSLNCVPPELFQLNKLVVLKLSNNCIQELPTAVHSSQCIYSSQSLKQLVLDGNKLKTLPEDLFLGLVNSLEHLSVQKNELTELPPGLWIMPHLKELNLSENKLSQLHYLCSDNTYTDGLNFPKMVIAAIDNDDGVCKLNSCSSQRGIVSDSIWTYIERLEIFYKTLHLASSGKFHVKNVQEWVRFLHEQRSRDQGAEDFDGNETESELPTILSREEYETSVLSSLNLSQNMFTKIPVQLPCLAPNLQRINMSHNQITSVDLVHSMPRNVSSVRLDHNCIENMDAQQPPLSICSSPCMLLLLQPSESNCCTHTAHNQLKSLVSLSLGHNKLKDFQTVHIDTNLDAENVVCSVVLHFPQLSILSLEHNELTSVPSGILSLTSLNSLNLAHNTGIVTLPNNLGLLSLSSLNLEGLSLAGIPINLVEKYSPKYLLGYLKGIVQGKESYRHMKLMLVGSANAGKTTLLLQLTKKGRMVHQRAVQVGINGLPLSTVGVELGQWEYSPTRSLPVVTFMTWDFGGQEEYYATHQCFISHRSIYLVIWDVRENEMGLRNIKTWLENIEARAPNAPVIVVGTHADCIKNTSALEKAFKKLYIEYNTSSFAYPKVQPHCFFVNSFSSSDMHQLRTYIYQFTQAYKNPGARKDDPPLIDQPIPLHYTAVLKIIQSLVRKCSNKHNIVPIFSKEEYIEEVFQCGFAGSVQEIVEASSFWHDNGIILHHKGVTMDELYCVDPQWLCAVMANVITVQERNPFQKNGFLHIDDCIKLFDVGSKQSFISAVISIMQSFEVILLLDQQSILIPSLMSQQRENAWAITQDSCGKLSMQNTTGQNPVPITTQKNVLLRHYILPFVPNGFFSRLTSRICANTSMIAQCKNLFKRCEPQLWCWREGVSLICNGMEVLRIAPVSYPLPGTESTYIVTSAGHEIVKKFSGIEVRVHKVLLDMDMESSLEPSHDAHSAAWLLQQAVECIDSIFDDWYIAFGRKRGFELSMILIGAPCNKCEARRLVDASSIMLQRSTIGRSRSTDTERVTGKSYFLFSSPFCAHTVAMKQQLQCPIHGSISVSQIAPDMLFEDLPESVVVNSESVLISALIGRGGFGSVFSGTIGRNVNESLQRIAIKQYIVVDDPSAEAESSAWQKYQEASREARVMSRLVHDNILSLVGVAIAPLMLLLELAPLGDLKACVERFQQANVKLNVWTLNSTLIQVAKALDYIHSNKFIFRDLKPGNILVWKFPLPENQWNSDSAVYVKLADYGICQQYTPQGVRGVEGTPPYLPPEVLLHGGQQSQNTKLDVYSFGMLMYYLFTFENPFYDETKPISSLLEIGRRPSLSFKQCPPSLWLLELMCWCWSEHPYHRPDLKEVITRLENSVTSQLVTAFPISNAGAEVHAVAAHTRFSRPFTMSLSVERPHTPSAPGYLNPFGYTKKANNAAIKCPSLDIWCASKNGLKRIDCQTAGLAIEDVEPLEGECFSVVYTGHDRVWVSRALSSGGQLSVYDARKFSRIAKWESKEYVMKLLYSPAEDAIVATTGNNLHVFLNHETFGDLKPVLSQPCAERFTEAVLVGVAERGSEVYLWYSVESKLKALRVSASGITGETFRLYASSIVEHMEPLGDTHENKVKQIVLSHRGYIEKWDVDTMERSAVCNCYDFCSHLCNQNYDTSKVTALLHWRDVLYVGTEGGIMLALNPDSLTAIWAIPATDTSIKILVGALLDPEDVRHGSHHGLPDRDSMATVDSKAPSLIISIGEKYTGVFKCSENVPPSLNPPGETGSGYNSTPRIKLLTPMSHATHLYVWSSVCSSQNGPEMNANPSEHLKHHRCTLRSRLKM